MKGRKPTPPAIQALTGSRNTLAASGQHPDGPAGVPHRPAWLDDGAVAVWLRTVPILRDMGLLTLADEAMLAGYCQACSRVAQAEASIAEDGLLFASKMGKRANPAVAMAAQARAEMKAFAAELGLSPTARARLTVAGGKGDNLEQFLAEKRTG